MDKSIGYLRARADGGGHEAICPRCERVMRERVGLRGDRTIALPRLFRENVYPYKQSCATCGRQLVKGQTPAWPELFAPSAPQVRAVGGKGRRAAGGAYDLLPGWKWTDQPGTAHRSYPSKRSAIVTLPSGGGAWLTFSGARGERILSEPHASPLAAMEAGDAAERFYRVGRPGTALMSRSLAPRGGKGRRPRGLVRYPTIKKPGDPTYSAEWSGVTGAPKARGLHCPRCAGPVHREAGSHYCPHCDDYVAPLDRAGALASSIWKLTR